MYWRSVESCWRARSHPVQSIWMDPTPMNAATGRFWRSTSSTALRANGCFTVTHSYEHDRENLGEGEWQKGSPARGSRHCKRGSDGHARLECEFRNSRLP